MGGMDPPSGDADLQHDPAAAPASPEQGAEASASAAPGSSPGPESEVGKPKIPQDVSEVSLADSFIMGVLRGWRLFPCRSHQPSFVCTLG